MWNRFPGFGRAQSSMAKFRPAAASAEDESTSPSGPLDLSGSSSSTYHGPVVQEGDGAGGEGGQYAPAVEDLSDGEDGPPLTHDEGSFSLFQPTQPNDDELLL